jgi:hypothetical protein
MRRAIEVVASAIALAVFCILMGAAITGFLTPDDPIYTQQQAEACYLSNGYDC